jgi:hypothetical protein
MKYHVTDLKGTLGTLYSNPAWQDFADTLEQISREDILDKHRAIASKRTTPPAGAQSAVNAVFKDRLTALGWASRPHLFEDAKYGDRGTWRLDFIKEGIGIDVSFNHLEKLAWTLTCISVAIKSRDVKPSSHVDAGVAVFPTHAFKTWGRMDAAVGVYEQAVLWLKIMEPVVDIPPVVLIGLDPGWAPTNDFRGTGTR